MIFHAGRGFDARRDIDAERPHTGDRGRDVFRRQPAGQQNAPLSGNLRRRGFAVTALLNVFEDADFADAAGPLVAEGIETRHLKEEASIMEICRQYVLR